MYRVYIIYDFASLSSDGFIIIQDSNFNILLLAH